ncbi:DNA polymerase III subunit gamma/tau [Solibacillus isronensis]|uniref:DNA polymerase III subunit gamma/tau n=1 Tax=Solibacillus isronensis TaxID=412383 RepID=UPI0039A25B36
MTTNTNTNLALYRKYRPSSFDNLVGQEHITTTLANSIKNNAVNHAYLFTGPRGTGKTSSALLFARAINCNEPDGINPCGKCAACENPIDIHELDAASNNGVDHIRELKETVSIMPLNGKYKVIILDEVHMLSTQAFNAFLKLLEEPPKHVVFILATTEVHKLPATVLSRCQRYDFSRITSATIVQRLQHILVQENRKMDEEALHLIAQVANGGLRDAVSLLDQALSMASNTDEVVTLDSVLALTGSVDVRIIGQLLLKIANKELESALELYNSTFNKGKEPKYFVEELLIYLRDILVFRKLQGKADLKKGHTDKNFAEVANAISNDAVFAYMKKLQQTVNDMKFHHDLSLLMEMTIIDMVTGADKSLQAQIDELRGLIGNGNISVSNVVNTPVEPIETINEPIVTNNQSLPTNFAPVEPTHELPAFDLGNDAVKVDENGTPQQPFINESDVTESVDVEDPIGFIKQAIKLAENGTDWATELPIDNKESVEIERTIEPQSFNVAVESEKLPELNESPVVEPQSFDVAAQLEQFPNFDESPQVEPQSFDTFVEPQGFEQPPVVEPQGFDLGVANVEPQGFDTPVEPQAFEQAPAVEQAPVQEQSISNVPTPLENRGIGVNLSDKETLALNTILTAKAGLLNEFEQVKPTIVAELQNKNLATKRIFNEFSVKAINDDCLVIVHENKIQVALINKLIHEKNIKEAFADVYKPLNYVALTQADWETVLANYDEVTKL